MKIITKALIFTGTFALMACTPKATESLWNIDFEDTSNIQMLMLEDQRFALVNLNETGENTRATIYNTDGNIVAEKNLGDIGVYPITKNGATGKYYQVGISATDIRYTRYSSDLTVDWTWVTPQLDGFDSAGVVAASWYAPADEFSIVSVGSTLYKIDGDGQFVSFISSDSDKNFGVLGIGAEWRVVTIRGDEVETFDSDLQLLSAFNIEGGQYRTTVYSDGVIYTNHQSLLSQYDVVTGNMNWSLTMPGYIYTLKAGDDSAIYVDYVDSESNKVSVSKILPSGDVQWTYNSSVANAFASKISNPGADGVVVSYTGASTERLVVGIADIVEDQGWVVNRTTYTIYHDIIDDAGVLKRQIIMDSYAKDVPDCSLWFCRETFVSNEGVTFTRSAFAVGDNIVLLSNITGYTKIIKDYVFEKQTPDYIELSFY